MSDIFYNQQNNWVDIDSNIPPAQWDQDSHSYKLTNATVLWFTQSVAIGDKMKFKLEWSKERSPDAKPYVIELLTESGNYSVYWDDDSPYIFEHVFTEPEQSGWLTLRVATDYNLWLQQPDVPIDVTITPIEEPVVLTHESSCMVQHQWQWSNSAVSGRWTTPRQYYRLRNPYYPPGGSISTQFDVVETRNKVRGHGKVLSILFTTEPGKDCVIYGWSIKMGINGNV